MNDSWLLPNSAHFRSELNLPSTSFKRLKLSLNKNRNRIVQLDESFDSSSESNLTVVDDAFIMGNTIVDGNHVNTTSGAIKIIGTPITSLKNLGNTCFLNSILYCLFYIREYRKIIHGVCVQLQIKYSERNKVKFPSSAETVVIKLHEVFCEMVNQSKNQQVGTDPNVLEFDCTVLSPDKLLNSLSTYNSIFEGKCEKDALDALNCIIECLESAKKKIQEKSGNKCGKRKIKNFEDFMFQGKLLMKTKCLECETYSESTENFSDIAIPTVSNIFDFQNAIKMKETLRDDDKYDCHICFRKNEAIRQCEYLQFPPIFVINLKPGYTRKRSWDEIHKSGDICLVPERIPCFIDHCQPQPCTNTSHEFILIAVITHIGASLMTGHFTTYIRGSVMNEKMDNILASSIEHKHLTRNLSRKNSMIEKMSLNCCDPQPNVLLENNWVFFDDEHVKLVKQLPDFGGTVSTERPYLLFYRNFKDS